VIVNLLSNALKFTDRGEIEVSASCVDRTATHCTLTVAVRDTGMGIPPERLKKLFQPFTQADASIARHFGGTGLGLSISKRLCELMGGTMEVNSAEGVGSTFRFTIRVGLASGQRSPLPAPLAGTVAGKRALVVDDNPTNRRILSAFLQRWEMEVIEAEGTTDALRRIEQGVVHLCLVDMFMPDGDGIALATKLRAHPHAATSAMVLLTSGHRDDARQQAAAAGIAAVLDKPIRQAAMYRAVCEVMGVQAKPEPPGAPAAADRVKERRSLAILLAEDNAVNRAVAQRMLAKLGYLAKHVNDGTEVEAALRQQPYDIVLMDVQMPGRDGLAATRLLRGDAAISQPWVIAMTANAMAGDRELCFAAGMDDYITKPVNLEELGDALRRAQPESRRQRFGSPNGPARGD
jgi:CheY-like chemotaxis protein/anti-sigma regulatory factor (Ser/Thr protein kinase)